MGAFGGGAGEARKFNLSKNLRINLIIAAAVIGYSNAEASIVTFDSLQTPSDIILFSTTTPSPTTLTLPSAPSAPELPKIDFNSADWLNVFVEAPAFWGIEITGSDLAKEDIAPLHLKSVVAVVSDAGVKDGATRVLNAGLTRRQPQHVNLRLIAHTGIGLLLPEFVERPKVKSILEQLPVLVPPSDFIYHPSHPTHGEHVAGLIGANNMPYGVSSVAEIEDLDIFQGESPFQPSSAEKAYEFLVSRVEPTPVLNMSHSVPATSEALTPLRKLARERDTICVVASHNQGVRLPPMASQSMLSDCMIVGAYGLTGTKTYFSNYGRAIDIVAPGESILSRGNGFPYKNTEIELMSGTSMAAPMVSGAMTILRALLPDAKANQLKEILYRTAIDLGKPGRDELTGYGLMNVVKAESVARRLLAHKITSSDQIQKALTKKRTFKFALEIAKLKLQRIKDKTLGVALNTAAYRKELLLDGSPKALLKLADLYESKGFGRFALGIKFAALNRENDLVGQKEMKDFGSKIAALTTYRLVRDFQDMAMVKSLANKALLFDMYSALSAPMASALTPEFVAQLDEIDPKANSALMALADQKACELSEICLNDSSKKAP